MTNSSDSSSSSTPSADALAAASTAKTPPRHAYVSHNSHTPIASIKRPRSSLERRTPHSSTTAARVDGQQNLTKNEMSGNVLAGCEGTDDEDDKDDDTSPIEMDDDTESGGLTSNAYTATPEGYSRGIDTSALSPLHPPRAVVSRDSHHTNGSEAGGGKGNFAANWVGAKVDALFSPVLNFLNDNENNNCNGTANNSTSTTCSNANTPTNITASNGDSIDSDEHSPTAASATTLSCIRDDDSTGSFQAVEDLDDDFNPWQFIKALPPYHLVRTMTPAVALPPKSPSAPPITLVLDLDETLVHCSVEEPSSCDLSFGVEFHGIDYQVFVKLRPHLHRFLQAVSQDFEVVVFTASQPVYANELLNRIDPNSTLVHQRLFRESCLQVEGNFLKDLNVLGRDLSQTVLVDNSPHAFGYQLDNGIPIESWFDDPQDRELLKLERFLRRLHGCDDVRSIIKNKFQNVKRVLSAPDYPHHGSH